MRKAALFLVICGLVGVNTSSAGVLKPVSGPGDLDLSGTVYYAVSQGSTADHLVSGRWVEGDNDGDTAPVGYQVGPSSAAVPWGYPQNIDQVAYPDLYNTYDSIRYGGGQPLNLTFAHLPPGEQVQVQLLFCEGWHSTPDRPLDVTIQGNLEFDDLNPVNEWGYRNAGAAVALATVGSDGTLNVGITAPTGPDHTPILNGIVVSSHGIKQVAGAADLDLNRVRYAVNVGGDDSPVVGGVAFRSDELESIPGYTISEPNSRATNWGTPPIITDPELREVYDDIRYRGGTLTQTFANLRPDTPVKVQVLLSENFHPQPSNPTRRRPLDVTVEGRKAWDDFDPLDEWGHATPGVLTTYAHVGSDGVLNIEYAANAGPDTNAIVNGVIVSDIPGYRAVPVGVTASAEYSAEFPATAVVDGSWSETSSGGVYDFWLLPSGQTGYLEFDFGVNWDLKFVEIHNTDNRQYGDRGTVAYHVDIAPDATFAVSETIASGTLSTYDEGWTMRPLSSDRLWRYARFYVDDFGGSLAFTGGGLAEIAFYGSVPEPGSIALLALGGLAVLLCRRRKRHATRSARVSPRSARVS